MTNEQLFLAIGVPVFFNGVLAVVLTTFFNARVGDLRAYVDKRFDHVDQRFDHVEKRWDSNFKHVLDKLDELESRLTK